MPIITPPSPTPPTPKPLTQAQAQIVAKSLINSQINSLYRKMLAVYNSAMGSVWSNTNAYVDGNGVAQAGLTPQLVLDAYGTDAASLFNLASILSTAVNSATPNTITSSAPAVTINPDGTVTVLTGA